MWPKFIFCAIFSASLIDCKNKDDIETTCIEKKCSGHNKFIVSPEELDKDWQLPFRNASKIWEEFIPWIDKSVNFSQLPLVVQRVIIKHRNQSGFNVTYKRVHPCWVLKPIDLLCAMKSQVMLRTIVYGDGKFTGTEWKKYLPKKQFSEIIPRYKSCAVISSSSSLKNLSLGTEIDRHDAVLRFNFAPTKGFEKDVGNKTTIRMINSMAFNLNYKSFLNYSSDENIIFFFDPSRYHESLDGWYDRPQFDFHARYKMHKRNHSAQTFFIIDPMSLWTMWDFIQDFSGDVLQKTITSSGFMGIVIAMNLCDVTHVYGYLPSPTSVTKKCYYFSDFIDLTCTYGGYHPELYEKNIIVGIRQGKREDVAQWGRVTLPGFNDYLCLD